MIVHELYGIYYETFSIFRICQFLLIMHCMQDINRTSCEINLENKTTLALARMWTYARQKRNDLTILFIWWTLPYIRLNLCNVTCQLSTHGAWIQLAMKQMGHYILKIIVKHLYLDINFVVLKSHFRHKIVDNRILFNSFHGHSYTDLQMKTPLTKLKTNLNIAK